MFHSFKKKFNSTLLTFLLMVTLGLTGCSTMTEIRASDALVNAAARTLNTLKSRADLDQFNAELQKAAGVAIFPSVYKAGFFIGAEGGNGLLIAKDTNGHWGYPAFYTLASGSWGFQMGGQKSGIIFIIRNPGAVAALIKHQGNVSAGVGVAVGSIGAGLKGAVTTNLGADIIAYSESKGLYGGFSLGGSALVRRNDLNSEYYGGQVEPKAILLQHAHQNPQADVLRHNLREQR